MPMAHGVVATVDRYIRNTSDTTPKRGYPNQVRIIRMY
jgi:hypothetical protein